METMLGGGVLDNPAQSRVDNAIVPTSPSSKLKVDPNHPNPHNSIQRSADDALLISIPTTRVGQPIGMNEQNIQPLVLPILAPRIGGQPP